MARALVTGAGGFVGAHLCAHLRAEGDEVIALDRSDAVPFDVTDRDRVARTFAEVRPEAVYHLAAFTHVGESWDAPAEVVRVNVEGTVNVLDAARATGVGRVLVVGSAEEYGIVREEDVPVRETAPLQPATPYGASKAAAEQFALEAYREHGLATVCARPFNHTGPGQSDRFLVPALARRIVEAERRGDGEVRVGSLDPVRDLTDVRDVVRAYRLLVTRAEAGEVYNVCSGRGVSVREVAERLVARAARPLRLAVDPALVRPVDVPRLVGDNTKLAAATGWRPERSLDDTLAAVLAAARGPEPASPTV